MEQVLPSEPNEIDEETSLLYKKSHDATTIEDDLFYWFAVGAKNPKDRKGGYGGKTNPALRARRILGPYNRTYASSRDTLLVTSNHEVIESVKHYNRTHPDEPIDFVELKNPQLHELPADVVIHFRLFLQELVSSCSPLEMRALAYILVHDKLDIYLDLFSPDEVQPLWDVVELLYRLIERYGKINKYVFICKSKNGTRLESDTIENTLRDKLRILLGARKQNEEKTRNG